MNADRFDDLAHQIAQAPAVNRRRILGRMFGLLAGVAAVATVEAEPAFAGKPVHGVTCPPGLTVCDNLCRDLNADAVNCGTCGTCGQTCTASQTCRGGICVDIPCTCPTTCPPGQTDCNGSCIDLATSNANCGTCGHACETGQTCVDGTCSNSCPSGQILCGGVCTDTSSDLNNCGVCGNNCPPSSTCGTVICSNGTCTTVPAAVGTPCGPSTCEDSTHSSVAVCNGGGTCVRITTNCLNYVCDNLTGTCLTTCQTSVDCSADTHAPAAFALQPGLGPPNDVQDLPAPDHRVASARSEHGRWLPVSTARVR